MDVVSRARALFGRIKDSGIRHPNASTLLLVLVAYCLLTVIMTYPAPLNALTELAGSADVFPYMWELWWAKRSVVDLQTSPANLVALHYPYGAHHPVLLLDACLMWTALPVVMLFGPLVAYNVQLLSSYVLTGFTTYLLCYSLTKKHWPSFVGGVIFAFSPWRSGRAAHGALNLALTYWLPLYVLFLIRLFKNPSARNALLCGLFLALSILSGPLHVAHFVIPLTAVFLVHQHFANRQLLYSMRFWKNWGTVMVLAGAIVLPFYLPLVQEGMTGEVDYLRRLGFLAHSAPLLSFVVPPPTQLLAEQVHSLRVFAQDLLPRDYDVVYVGIVALALSVCAALSRRTRIWLVLAAVSAVLALGPLLRVGREWVEYSVAGKTGFVLMPGALLARLPFYEWIRDPARFGELTAFCIAVSASYGVSLLCRIVSRRTAQYALVSGLVVCILLDFSSFLPFPTSGIPIPEFYGSLSVERDGYGILDISPSMLNYRSMYFQTVHQHPIAVGSIYRIPSGARHYQRFLEQLVKPTTDIINAHGLVPVLEQLNIRYAVLHKVSDASTEEFTSFLGENFGKPVYEDDQIAAFGVPLTEPARAGRAIPLLVLGEQWHPIESIDGIPSRWMVNDGKLYVRVETDGPYQLVFVAHPFREPRHLQVFVNEEQIEEYHVGGMQSYVTSAFMLKSREWTPISFHVPEGCEVPSEVIDGQTDARCLSMLFQQVGVRVVQSEMW